MPGASFDHFSNWRTLTPTQRNALVWQIAHQAHAARAHAMREAARSSVRRLLGWLASVLAVASLPTAARRGR